ncbi:Hypothetical predicted protein [Mytilus galloprovincialis]|uniref:Uncharacterized protein n=1 Tax=Mytilus galloprovincialis TaxID=29158 RepID=A0A8B6G2J1_MYTGA|nr:Hypothetical predicted protein [Mytilus galloprovincialis]
MFLLQSRRGIKFAKLKDDDTPLHLAVKGGYLDIVKLLLERTDINPNKVNEDDDTVLHLAVKDGYLDIVKLLLEQTDIDPNKVNEDDDTVLHLAVKGGYLDIVKLLLEQTDIDPNKVNEDADTPLHLAVEGGYLDIVKLLLEQSDIDQNKVNKDDDTLLHSAVKGGYIDIVKLLLEQTAIDPNKVYKDDDTLLHLAVKGGYLDIVKLLLERTDTDPNKVNKLELEFWNSRIGHLLICCRLESRCFTNKLNYLKEKEKMPNKRNAIGSPSRAMGKKRRTANRTGGQRMQNEEIPQKKYGAGRRRTAKKTQGVGHVVAEGPVETTDFSSGNESEEDARAFPSLRHDPLHKNFEIANNSIDFTPSQESSIHDTVGEHAI